MLGFGSYAGRDIRGTLTVHRVEGASAGKPRRDLRQDRYRILHFQLQPFLLVAIWFVHCLRVEHDVRRNGA